eukprot:15362426-Ditylum_brightwellii.AAC.1
MKVAKECYLVQLAEYAHCQHILQEPTFAWWVPHTPKNRNCIIAKIKSKYWARTHKYGIPVPKSVQEAKEIDRQNGNTLW